MLGWLKRLFRSDCYDEVVTVSGKRGPDFHRDINITAAENGYVVVAYSSRYDEKAKVYVVTDIDKLPETIALAMVNKRLAER